VRASQPTTPSHWVPHLRLQRGHVQQAQRTLRSRSLRHLAALELREHPLLLLRRRRRRRRGRSRGARSLPSYCLVKNRKQSLLTG
jgi:hypothetical protein